MACRAFRWRIAKILSFKGFKPKYKIPDCWWNDYHAWCYYSSPDIRVCFEDCQAKGHGLIGCKPWQGLDGYYLRWSGISWRHKSCLIIDIFLSYLISFIFSFFILLGGLFLFFYFICRFFLIFLFYLQVFSYFIFVDFFLIFLVVDWIIFFFITINNQYYFFEF